MTGNVFWAKGERNRQTNEITLTNSTLVGRHAPAPFHLNLGYALTSSLDSKVEVTFSLLLDPVEKGKLKVEWRAGKIAHLQIINKDEGGRVDRLADIYAKHLVHCIIKR